jgi:peptidoglycan/xylan/chitin deacetylase (PgdA/CDA1 family)
MKRLASLSLDLDNEWSYQRTHGDPEWRSYASYLDRVVPAALEMFDELGLRTTFFIVGRDAADPAHGPVMRILGDSEHELGNHSYEHLPWLHRYEADALAAELTLAHDAIATAAGRAPVGFRGPGFSLSPETLEALAGLGYRFDATALPTWIGPLARRYYFRGAGDLTDTEREERAMLFGNARDGLQRNKPYRWAVGDREIIEIPVTTFPGLRTPFHVSYLLYLSERSPRVADAYLASALRACVLRREGPSVLLHPLDFLGGDEVSSLAFFPGMAMPGAIKRERVRRYLQRLGSTFDVVPVGEHAAQAASRSLPLRAAATAGTASNEDEGNGFPGRTTELRGPRRPEDERRA